MRQLQEEHAEWLAQKYPHQTPKVPAVGCVEEAGELVHAIAKIELVRVWGEDNRHKLSMLRTKLVDAIGDCGIFVCSLCNANEWDFESWWCSAAPFTEEGTVLDAAIQLVQTGCLVALKPGHSEALSCYISQLKTVAGQLGLDAEVCVKQTWLIVKER